MGNFILMEGSGVSQGRNFAGYFKTGIKILLQMVKKYNNCLVRDNWMATVTKLSRLFFVEDCGAKADLF